MEKFDGYSVPTLLSSEKLEDTQSEYCDEREGLDD